MDKKSQTLGDMLPENIKRNWERISLAKRKKKLVSLSPQGLPYATFERRLLASSIDAVIIALCLMPFNNPIMHGLYDSANARYPITPDMDEMTMQLMQLQAMLYVFTTLSILQIGLFGIYSAVFWHFYSATPGKWVMRMRIVNDSTGEPIGTKQILLRLFGYGIASLPLCLGVFAIAWNAKRQGWHDRIAKTAVVALPLPLDKLRLRRSAADPSDSPAPAAEEPAASPPVESREN